MEVILKEDVSSLGHRGDVVKVAGGYGRNYLLPRKLAIWTTMFDGPWPWLKSSDKKEFLLFSQPGRHPPGRSLANHIFRMRPMSPGETH